MKSILKKGIITASFLAFSALFVFATPIATHAQNQNVGIPNPSTPTAENDPTQSGFQIVSCNPQYDPANPNVLKDDCNYQALFKTIQRLIQFVLYALVFIVAGMILYTGFQFLTAGGDVGKVTAAKKMIKPIVLGLISIFVAWFAVYTLLDYFLVDTTQGGVDKASIIPAELLNKSK